MIGRQAMEFSLLNYPDRDIVSANLIQIHPQAEAQVLSPLLERIKKQPLIFDSAMGAMIYQRGIS